MLLRLLLIVVATVAIVIATSSPQHDVSVDHVALTSLLTDAEPVADVDLVDALVVPVWSIAPLRPHAPPERLSTSRTPSSPDAGRVFRPPRAALS